MNPQLEKAAYDILHWIDRTIFTVQNLIELAAICGVFIAIVLFLQRPLQRFMQNRVADKNTYVAIRVALDILEKAVTPLVALIIFALAEAVAEMFEMRLHIVRIAHSLTAAWLMIRLASQLLPNKTLSKLFALCAWIVAALDILGALNPTISLLSSMSISIGKINITAWMVLKAILTLFVLLWSFNALTNVIDRSLKKSKNLAPGLRLVITRVVRLVFFAIAFLLTLSFVGIDVTALAVFSGALGVGIGLGLQKTFSNLVTGFTLLLDKSIKPGDVIQVGSEFGWITAINGRYVALSTVDGLSYLIPNEKLITDTVINWSYNNDLVRLRIPVGVHYKSDVEKAIQVCIEAAGRVSRILKDPPPSCAIAGFEENAIRLEVLVWISDPRNGLVGVKGALNLEIWRLFKKHGIQIPYPQRDLYLKEMPAGGAGAAAGKVKSPARKTSPKKSRKK